MPATPQNQPIATVAPKEVIATIDSGEVIINGVAIVPKFAVIDFAVSGNNTLVAAVAGKRIRVLALAMVAGGTVTPRFQSGAGGTNLSGQMVMAVNNPFILPFNPVGWFQTAASALLNLELSAGVTVDGMLVYIEV